ncbi:MAG: acetyltransferase [Phycisphaerales bacterium]|jgi:acetyltransferase|nr:acetyltransferase [Phycisphaerales bacterium]
MTVDIRPILASDEAMMIRFHQTLSSDSVHDRYFGTLALGQRIEHDRLVHVCHPDVGDVVFVVEIVASEGVREIVAVARLSTAPGRTDGEVALIVSDLFQHRGLGGELLRRLIRAAKDAHLTQLYAHVLSGNAAMLRLCSEVGMVIPSCEIGSDVKAVLDLRADNGNESLGNVRAH